MLWLCLALLLAATASAQPDFYLNDGDRLVFYCDSITDQRLYTTFTESYVLTRFPRMNVTFVHSDWVVTALPEDGTSDWRPLLRDVAAYKPTELTIMLGMNNGSYRAFHPDIFLRYSRGSNALHNAQAGWQGLRSSAVAPCPSGGAILGDEDGNEKKQKEDQDEHPTLKRRDS